MDSNLADDALRFFLDAQKLGKLFGVVELHFQDGRIIRVKKQETLMPSELNRLTA